MKELAHLSPTLFFLLFFYFKILGSHSKVISYFLFLLLQNGTIHAWKANKETNAFKPATTLEGHNGAVVSLTVGGGRLYSGSMDNTIRVGLIKLFYMLLYHFSMQSGLEICQLEFLH